MELNFLSLIPSPPCHTFVLAAKIPSTSHGKRQIALFVPFSNLVLFAFPGRGWKLFSRWTKKFPLVDHSEQVSRGLRTLLTWSGMCLSNSFCISAWVTAITALNPVGSKSEGPVAKTLLFPGEEGGPAASFFLASWTSGSFGSCMSSFSCSISGLGNSGSIFRRLVSLLKYQES